MYKLNISYQDFNGNDRRDSFFFNYTEAEVLELDFQEKDGIEGYINRIIKAEDGKSIIKFIKEIILKAYGEKTADGRGFVKSKELSDSFASTNAFSKLLLSLATDAKAAASFINGCTSKSLVVKDLEENESDTPDA